MLQSYQSIGTNLKANINNNKFSSNSLAYSESTGFNYSDEEIMPTISPLAAESTLLNQPNVQTPTLPWTKTNVYTPKFYDDDASQATSSSIWICQPRIRTWLCVSVILSLVTTGLLLFAGTVDADWLDNFLENGFSGLSAQNVASASLVHMPKATASIHLSPKSTLDAPEGCESTIMLIRHCEKGNLKSHCNYNGLERAAYLATQFGDGKERWPAPTDIYALKATGRGKLNEKKNFREIETVARVSDKVGVKINKDYETFDVKPMSDEILTKILGGEMCGKMTLIAWKHSDIPRLAQHLGCGPLQGCPVDYKGNEFDQIWQIKYVYRTFHSGSDGHKLHKHWSIFGSVQREKFDPLAFSKSVGDYPKGGTSTGASWAEPGDQAIYGR